MTRQRRPRSRLLLPALNRRPCPRKTPLRPCPSVFPAARLLSAPVSAAQHPLPFSAALPLPAAPLGAHTLPRPSGSGKYNVDFAAASLELEAKTGYNKLNFSVWRLLCRTITVYCPVPASCWVCLPVSPPERHPPAPWTTIWHWTWARISKNIQPPRLI